jgi:conjugal transfer/entry exclusion protein
MKKRVLVIALVALSCAVPALAIFGVGDIVYDPNNFEEAVQELVQLEQQYVQLVQTYEMIQNQYQEMLWMAKGVPVNMALRYRAIATPWLPSSATNTYGATGGWTLGINTGQGVSAGYQAATTPLAVYGSGFGNIPDDQSGRVKTSYATVELTDGANLAAMQTIGQMRGHAPEVETAIQNLEDDSLSADPAMNTEIAVLNKINAAGIITVRNQQDANQLLVALAEHQIIQAKRERDAEAQGFANHIRFMSDGRPAMAAQAANASGAMLAWRMP